MKLFLSVFAKEAPPSELEDAMAAAAAKDAADDAARPFNILNHCGFKYHDIVLELIEQRGEPASLQELTDLLTGAASAHELDASIGKLAAMLDAPGLGRLLKKLDLKALVPCQGTDDEVLACRARAAKGVADALAPRMRPMTPDAVRGPIEVALHLLEASKREPKLADKLGRVRWLLQHSTLVKPSNLDAYAASGKTGVSLTRTVTKKLGTTASIAVVIMSSILGLFLGIWMLMAFKKAIGDPDIGEDNWLRALYSCGLLMAALLAWFLVKF